MFATMKFTRIALFSASVLAQSQYGENHVNVNFDSQLVEQTAFPEPQVTLLSPAFLPRANASFDPGWSKGIEGATSQDELSIESTSNGRQFRANVTRSIFHWQSRRKEPIMDDLQGCSFC
jgi:hypothetical protein